MRFMTSVAAGPLTPVHAKISGEKMVFSTSIKHCLYFSFFKGFVIIVAFVYFLGAAFG